MSNLTERLSAMLVLAGSVRENQLEQAAGRSLLNMPVGGGRQVLDLWRDVAAQLSLRLNLDSLSVRVVYGGTAIPPMDTLDNSPMPIIIEGDPVELRGPGGVIADLAGQYDDDAYLLVTSGSQLPLFSIDEFTDQLRASESDVLMWTRADGVPVTLLLLRCGAVRDLPRIGYIDFKEQALPKIAAKFTVEVSRFEKSAMRTIRTMEDYLLGMRFMHRTVASPPSSNLGRWDDPWQPVFGIVEPGATIGSAVDLFDSVVLAGAEVGEGAIIVRSIICPGAKVASRANILDALIASPV